MPVTDQLGTLFTAIGFILRLSLESIKKISRTMLITITFAVTCMLVAVIYLSMYVWQDDDVLADLNGASAAGVLTRFDVQRAALINMLLLVAKSLKTIFKVNFADNKHFDLVEGHIMRRQILEVEKLCDDPAGDNDFVVNNSLAQLLTEHGRCIEDADPRAANPPLTPGNASIELVVNSLAECEL
jgi:hypothetical protein